MLGTSCEWWSLLSIAMILYMLIADVKYELYACRSSKYITQFMSMLCQHCPPFIVCVHLEAGGNCANYDCELDSDDAW